MTDITLGSSTLSYARRATLPSAENRYKYAKWPELTFHIIPDHIIPVEMSISINGELSIWVNFLLTGENNWDTGENEKTSPLHV